MPYAYLRKHIFLTVDLTGGATASGIKLQIVDVNFLPHEVVVKNVAFKTTATTQPAEICLVGTDLIGGDIICSFPPTYDFTEMKDGHFNLYEKPVGGNTFKFYFTNQAGGLSGIKGYLSIELEFIRYDVKDHQKP